MERFYLLDKNGCITNVTPLPLLFALNKDVMPRAEDRHLECQEEGQGVQILTLTFSSH